MNNWFVRHGRKSWLSHILLCWCALAGLAHAFPPPDHADFPLSKIHDYGTYADTSEIQMFVTNRGWLGHDRARLLGRSAGLYFPRGSNHTLLYAAGFWMAAKFGKGARASVAEYDADFAPGPVVDGSASADNAQFRVFKITPGDTYESNLDYAAWPYDQGAPALKDQAGEDSLDWLSRRIPRVLGDQTFWCVFNDLDPTLHISDPGSLRPLGIEVRLLAWVDEWPGSLGRTIFLHYTIINQSDSLLREARVGLWADPDIGDPNDDLAGSDSSLSLGYCYNNGPDAQYGEAPPAVGLAVLGGPFIEWPGDSAWSVGTASWRHQRRALPMTGFAAWGPGDDPRAEPDVYYLTTGRDRTGVPQTDPTNNLPTSFYYPGDPGTQSGWRDENPSDRRLVVGVGSVTMAPGDTQEVVAAVLVGHGEDAIASIASLKQAAQAAHALYQGCFTPAVASTVDILPSQCPNLVSLRDPSDLRIFRPAQALPRQEIMVALYSTPEFDAVAADPREAFLGGITPSHWTIEDIGTPGTHETPCDCASSHRDGLPDLLLAFDRARIIEILEPVVDGAVRTLAMHALGKDGSRANATDCLTLVDVDAGVVLHLTETEPADPGNVIGLSNQPNPFNAATLISYRVVREGPVYLAIFDILGRRVAVLVDGWHAAGEYQVGWNGFEANGYPAGSGMYFYRLESSGQTLTRKMVLLK